MAEISKSSLDLLDTARRWHSSDLRHTAVAAVELVLEVSKNTGIGWKYSQKERQWTANPNFIAFRFPARVDQLTIWLYTRGLIAEIDGLEFCGDRPKRTPPTYQCVKVNSPNQLPSLTRYIHQAYRLRSER